MVGEKQGGSNIFDLLYGPSLESNINITFLVSCTFPWPNQWPFSVLKSEYLKLLPYCE